MNHEYELNEHKSTERIFSPLGYGLKVSEPEIRHLPANHPKKTKIMVVDRNRTKKDFTIDGQQIEEVSHFEYLDSMINNIGDSTVEIKRRLAITRSTVQSMQNVWKSCGISISLKIRLLNAVAFSISTYGCESWAMTKNDKKRVSRCGVTDVSCKQHGKTKELTPGYLKGLEQICTSDLGSSRESTDILVILSEETAVLKSKFFKVL